MVVVDLDPRVGGVDAQVGGIVSYLGQAMARQLVSDLRGQGLDEVEVLRKLRMACELFGWGESVV